MDSYPFVKAVARDSYPFLKASSREMTDWDVKENGVGSFSFVKVPNFLRVSRSNIVAETRTNALRKP